MALGQAQIRLFVTKLLNMVTTKTKDNKCLAQMEKEKWYSM